MDIPGSILLAGISFGRNLLGLIFRPYETYRRITREASAFELLFIGMLLTVYFAVASVVKTSAFRPFLLTATFIKLASAAGVGFILIVAVFWFSGRFVKSSEKLKGLLIGWAYTLVPTLCWFLSTSLLYLILPPPRTTSVAGIAFSLIFLIFSVALLFWKIMLSYLTLRFGLRLDIKRILIVTMVSLPVAGFYSYLMYRLGIFKVPFL